jgi:hypothetical protein
MVAVLLLKWREKMPRRPALLAAVVRELWCDADAAALADALEARRRKAC